MSTERPQIGIRADYRHFLSIATRWMDNDVYGHVNNVVYYSYFDTLINRYLIDEGGLDFHEAAPSSASPSKPCAATTSRSPTPTSSTAA